MPRLPDVRRSSGRNSFDLVSFTQTVVILALVIFLAALAASFSRPIGFLAVFWPANAVLAGVLVRFAAGHRIPALLGALAGYLVAACVVGDGLVGGLTMTLANMVGAAVFAVVYSSFPEDWRGLTRLWGVATLTCSALAASVISAAIGGPYWSTLIGRPPVDGAINWFAAELVNYLALMPVMLTTGWPPRWPRNADWRRVLSGSVALPVAVFAASLGISLLIPHPLAIVMPVAALVWCAFMLPLAATCWLILIYAGTAMMGLKLGLFNFNRGAPLSTGILGIVHSGIAFLALGPLLVLGANSERRQYLSRLERAVRIDSLTEALTRKTFFEEGESLLRRVRQRKSSIAVLMIDADHFKQVNDTHGHAAGDRVLVAVSAAIRASIRQHDLLGRLGGEEFALILPDTDRDGAWQIATRLRRMIERLEVILDNGDVLQVTVSIGIADDPSARNELDEMVSRADLAMYEAKRAGRNRVELAASANQN